MQDVISSLDLHTVFPRLKNCDQRMHSVALVAVLEEAKDNITANL